MGDDWSLKGRGQVAHPPFYLNIDDNYELRRVHEKFNEEPQAYLKKDIEILRLKLLEDFDSWLTDYIIGEVYPSSFIFMVNRRFGVKE